MKFIHLDLLHGDEEGEREGADDQEDGEEPEQSSNAGSKPALIICRGSLNLIIFAYFNTFILCFFAHIILTLHSGVFVFLVNIFKLLFPVSIGLVYQVSM